MKKVLIIRLTALGDVVFTLPLACVLKENDFQVGWLVAEKGLGLIQNNPCVDKCHFVPLNEWKKRPFSIKTIVEFLSLVRELRNEKYDIAFDCHQMFKNLLLFAFCGAKRRITVKGARELSWLGANEFMNPKADFRDFNYHIVERNLDFARYIGVEVKDINFKLPEISKSVDEYVSSLLKDADSSIPNVIVAPATTWENKHWAIENWAKVVSSMIGRANIIFSATKNDEALVDKIVEAVGQKFEHINLTGKTNIEELRALFLHSHLVISPDSGSAHLAWASSKPAVIAIFTATPPLRFGPYGNIGKYFSVSSNLKCQPCFKKACKLKEQNLCSTLPSSEEIINIVNRILL